MRSNQVKQKLEQGGVVIGSFLYVPSGKLTEFISLCGFDFIVIDEEHGSIGVENAEEMVRACELSGTTPIVRVGELNAHCILQALDIGSMGIHVPAVNTVEQACAAVRMVKYAPDGKRGLAGVRAAGYGLSTPLRDYCDSSNRQTMVIIHIEDMDAIVKLDDLLAVEGIDVYFLGPTDLSNSLGRPGCIDADVRNIVDNALRKIIQAGKVAGTITNDPEVAQRYIEMGVRYLATHALGLMATASQSFLNGLRGRSLG